MIDNKEDIVEREERILRALRLNPDGLNITMITKITGIPKCFIRVSLSKLEGKGLVYVIRIGMSKIYKLNTA